ncbi:MAG: hypothetical protein KBT03_03225 [Bacteroidales bacterium]|nr:hypothetical protein [Candidatus Scybalousia scybalohippi]
MEVSATTTALLNGNVTNIIVLAIFVVIILLFLTLLTKSGLIGFRGRKLSIGNDEKSREILRRQIEYLTNISRNFETVIDDSEENEYRTKYATEKVLDEMVKWCCVNHISNDEFYITNKQTIVWGILKGIGEVKTDVNKKKCDELVESIIKQLIKTKEYYKNS